MSDHDKLRIRRAAAEDMSDLGHVLGPDQAHFYGSRIAREGVVLTARMAGRMAGALYASWEPADEVEVRRHLPGVPLLYRLQVTGDLRRRRIGTRLVQFAEALLSDRGHERVAVGVDLHNSEAAGLYGSLGYRDWANGEVDTIREVYRDGRLTSVPDRCRILLKDIA